MAVSRRIPEVRLVSGAFELLAKAAIACSFPQPCPTSSRLPLAAHPCLLLLTPPCWPVLPPHCCKVFPTSPGKTSSPSYWAVLSTRYPPRRRTILISVSLFHWLNSWTVESGVGVQPEEAAAVMMPPLFLHALGTVFISSVYSLLDNPVVIGGISPFTDEIEA